MVRGWFSILLFTGALTSCEIARPEGTYTTDPDAAVKSEADAARDTDEAIYGDARRPPADAGDATNPRDEASAPMASSLVGDYWMRADVHTSVSASLLGLSSLRTTTDAAVYALVAVRASGAALELRDFQCAVRIAQKCESGCSRISTTLRDAATSARAYLPPRRALSVDAEGHFAAGRGPYAIGWRGDFTGDVALPLPSDDADPLVYDPDGGGDGVDLVTTIRTAIGLPISCSFRSVQRVDVTYEGTLEGGKLVGGTMHDMGSDERELANSCSTDDPPEVAEAAPSTVRFIPAKASIDVDARPWACPTLEEFEAAFE